MCYELIDKYLTGAKEELTLPTPTIRVELPLLFTPHKSPTVID